MTTPHEHPFAQYVRTLGKGKKGSRSLDFEEAKSAFAMILRGQVEDIQLGAFLMLLRVKEESPEEIAGFVAACKEFINAPTDIQIDIDWSSYAGKRKQLPWFVLSLMILANKGHRIFIHGAKGHTAGRLYTEELFSSLGLPISRNWNEVSQHLDTSNLAFMSIENLCPPLHTMIEMRNHFGLRSPVHTLSRLINPLGASYSFQSIFHPAYAETHQLAAHILKQENMCVFKGESGEVERKPDATCLVKSLSKGMLHEEKWPRLLDGKTEAVESHDLKHFIQVAKGQVHDEYGMHAVTGTLAIISKSLNPSLSTTEAEAYAKQLWKERDLTLSL